MDTYTAHVKGGQLDGQPVEGLPLTADGKPQPVIFLNTESCKDVPYDFTGGYAPRGGRPVYACRSDA